MAKLDELWQDALHMALELLEKRGEFAPVCMVEMADGTVQPLIVAGDATDTNELIGWYVEELQARAQNGELAASALAVDVRVKHPETGAATDAIITMLRSAGHATDITTPYMLETSGFLRRKRTITLGTQVEATPTNNEVFG